MNQSLKTKSVLVVEDDSSLAEAYSLILEASHFMVDQASDGLKALKKLESNSYDLILLDLKMPNMDGVSFLKEYKKLYNDSSTKIVVFSNFDLQNEVKEAYELGIDKYFLKSWAAPRDLLKIVDEVLGS